MNRCQFEDTDGVRCEGRALPKYCDEHRGSAAATRQARRRSRNRAAQEMDERAERYLPPSEGPVSDGRTIPGVLQPALRVRVAGDDGVVDYTKADSAPRQASQERQPRRDMKGQHDFMIAASMRAADQYGIQAPTNLLDWGLYAELGQEEYDREMNRRQMEETNEPHRFPVVFTNRWNQHVYVDPTEADMVDGNGLAGWR